MPRATRSAEARFWEKVRTEGECLIWTGALDPLGCGRFRFRGKSALAHRVAWVLLRDEEPPIGFLYHTCANAACVNPDHLKLRNAPGKAKATWEFIDVRGYEECWEWQGNTTGSGYGVVIRDGRRRVAHRAVYEEFVHEIFDDEIVMHTCDNPPCCNPMHLRLGTQADNMADMVAKGRR